MKGQDISTSTPNRVSQYIVQVCDEKVILEIHKKMYFQWLMVRFQNISYYIVNKKGTTNENVEATSPQTGYNYPVPENPLTLPTRRTTLPATQGRKFVVKYCISILVFFTAM